MLHFYRKLCIFSNYYLNLAIKIFFSVLINTHSHFFWCALCLLSVLRNCLHFELARNPKLAQTP